MREVRWTALLGILLVTWTGETPCRADEAMDACVRSYVRAQRLRKFQDLLGSRKQLAMCIHPRCPTELRRDCLKWMEEVDAEMPSFIVEGRDAEGNAAALQVRVDEKPAVHAGGVPILVNPGPHVFEVKAGSASPATYRVIARAGEKERRLHVVVAPAVPGHVWALAGLGVLELGAATYFFLRGNELGDCGDACTPGDEDAATTANVAAGVSLGMAALSLGAAGWFYWQRPRVQWSEPIREAPATRVGLRLQPHGSMFEVSGRF